MDTAPTTPEEIQSPAPESSTWLLQQHECRKFPGWCMRWMPTARSGVVARWRATAPWSPAPEINASATHIGIAGSWPLIVPDDVPLVGRLLAVAADARGWLAKGMPRAGFSAASVLCDSAVVQSEPAIRMRSVLDAQLAAAWALAAAFGASIAGEIECEGRNACLFDCDPSAQAYAHAAWQRLLAARVHAETNAVARGGWTIRWDYLGAVSLRPLCLSDMVPPGPAAEEVQP